MPREHSNKLSIYLIKTAYTSADEILKANELIKTEQVAEIGNIHYGDSHVSPPGWVSKFFKGLYNNENSEGRLKIFGASARAVFVTTVEGRIFVIAFGYGHTLLRPGVWEERFGLKVFLNVVDPEHLRSINKKNMTVVPKLSTEQMTKDGSVADFGIDVEQDLIQGMTGKSKDERFGRTMTGKDALSVSIKFDIHSIRDFLRLCLEKYLSLDYRTEFGFIDQITEINNQSKIDVLNTQIMAKIRDADFEKVWMAVPEVLPWEKVSEFKISGIADSLGDDICLSDFLRLLPEAQRTELLSYQNYTIDCIGTSSGEIINSWNAFDCLCGEINNDGTHILSNGKWYQIEADFATQVDNEFKAFRDHSSSTTVFPHCHESEHENQYNERASRELGICNMDMKLVSLGGPRNKIEFCDLFTTDKKIVHVKRYGASSVLSHLFAQGLVSGELMLYQEFRDKVREKLPDNYKELMPDTKPDVGNYEIIYAIISKGADLIDIPFFSKVNLRNAKRRLEAFGYRVSFKKISISHN